MTIATLALPTPRSTVGRWALGAPAVLCVLDAEILLGLDDRLRGAAALVHPGG